MKEEILRQVLSQNLYPLLYMKKGKFRFKNSQFYFRFGPFFVSPVVAGFDKISETEYKPVVVTYDSIGCF